MDNRVNYQITEKQLDRSADSLYVEIVERIRRSIQEGKLQEGDKLPSERELAQKFDVSRVPVREALKILEYLGAVQHVRGKGVFVKKIDYGQALNNIDFFLRDPESVLVDLMEAREPFEEKAAYLAALRRTPEDLAAMEDALLQMEFNISKGKDIREPSFQFHSALIAASHNQILIQINNFLADLLKFSRNYSLKDPEQYEATQVGHRRIFQKIKEQDAEGAVQAAREHLKMIAKLTLEPDK